MDAKSRAVNVARHPGREFVVTESVSHFLQKRTTRIGGRIFVFKPSCYVVYPYPNACSDLSRSWERSYASTLIWSFFLSTPVSILSTRYAIEPSTRRLCLSSSSNVETMASVVKSKPAMLAAFANAVRTTLTGSMTPALSMSVYSPVNAL